MTDILLVASLGILNLAGAVHTIIIGLHVWSGRQRVVLASIGCGAGVVLSVCLSAIDAPSLAISAAAFLDIAGGAMFVLLPIWLYQLLSYSHQRGVHAKKAR